MVAHQGRNEVRRRKERLTAVIGSIGSEVRPELASHFARYLCVLLSGFAEQSAKELVTHYCRTSSNPKIQRYVGQQLKRLRNIDHEKLKQLVESFDLQWWAELTEKYPDELLAFDSVATLRNNISHGGDSGITLATVKQYFQQVSVVVDALCDLFDPVHRTVAGGAGDPSA